MRASGLKEVISDLWSVGYECEWHIISARSVGAPHLRERIWIIAYPDSELLRPEQVAIKERKRTTVVGVDGEGRYIESSYPSSEGLERQLFKQFKGGEINRVGEAIRTASNCPSLQNVTPYPHDFRLWQPFASEEEKSKWWAEATAGFRNWWKTESPICRMDDGISKRLDKNRRERIKALGNSLVPQIAELIGRAIIDYEKGCNENI